ncbi:SGNH hydrolase domain-containing protein [Bradyrhizobium sp. CCBAU 051011]|uniref:SGNH hydrolase domain-containing protein n=1 Tax=Bradyrhizobium sp. CCBAU 051011 TaxID=858422 RepID=UPI00352AD11D
MRRFHPSGVLCRTGACSATIEGRPAYFDNNHLAASASEFWSRIFDDFDLPTGRHEP